VIATVQLNKFNKIEKNNNNATKKINKGFKTKHRNVVLYDL